MAIFSVRSSKIITKDSNIIEWASNVRWVLFHRFCRINVISSEHFDSIGLPSMNVKWCEKSFVFTQYSALGAEYVNVWQTLLEAEKKRCLSTLGSFQLKYEQHETSLSLYSHKAVDTHFGIRFESKENYFLQQQQQQEMFIDNLIRLLCFKMMILILNLSSYRSHNHPCQP